MAFNGSGTFSRLYNWASEQLSSPIEIAKLDTQEEDIAAGLSNCVLRDGTGKPTADQDWNGQDLTGVAAFGATGAATVARVVVNGATVPANGLYLPAANTVGLSSNTTLRASVNSEGNWTFVAPSSGTAMTVTGVASATAGRFTDGANYAILLKQKGASTAYVGAEAGFAFAIGANDEADLSISTAGNVTIAAPSSGTACTINGLAGEIGLQVAGNFQGNWPIEVTSTGGATTGRVAISFVRQGGTNKQWAIGNNPDGASDNAFGIRDITRGVIPFQIGTSGNVTINAPSSGVALNIAAVTGTQALNISGPTNYSQMSFNDGTVTAYAGIGAFATASYNFGASTAHASSWYTDSDARVTLSATGNVTINAADSGDELTVTGSVVATSFAGALTGNVTGNVTGLGTLTDASTVNSIQVGFRGIPQNAQTGNYTCVLADAGKHVYHAAGAGAGDTYTIPANASVAYEIGTALTFVNRDTTNSVSIAITTDTLTMAVTGSTGARTLAAYGIATAIKVTSTEWMISGSGLS